MGLISHKFMDCRIKTTIASHDYRKGGGPKFAFELIRKHGENLTIREFIQQGGMDKYLCQLIGQGRVVVEGFPNWNTPDDSSETPFKKKFDQEDLPDFPNAGDFLQAFFKKGGSLEDLNLQLKIIMGEQKEEEEGDELEKNLRLVKRLITPKAGYEVPKMYDSKVDILPEEWPRLVSLAKIKENILMVGPSGCGKTYIGKRLADELELTFGSISCSAGMDESHLSGWLIPMGDYGKMEYVPTPFVEIYENGGVFLIDELDAADENTMVFINSALANEEFMVPQRFKNPVIQKHKDFVCIAAANTYGYGESIEYTARNALDAATLDRFGTGLVPMDYSTKVEEMLVAPIVLTWGRRVRTSIKNHRIKRFLSTRRLIRFTIQTQVLGWGRNEWEYSYFADWTKEDKSKLINDGVIKTL